MAEPRPGSPAPCPECGAPCQSSEAFCWMCHRRLWTPQVKTPQPAPPAITQASAPQDLKTTSPVITVTQAAIFLGAWLLSPAMGFTVGFFMIPSLLTTWAREERSVAGAVEGKTLGAQLRLMLAHLLLGAAIFIQVVAVICVAIFFVCLYGLANYH